MSTFKNIMQYRSFTHRAHFRSCVVKLVITSFVLIPSIERSKRDVFITVVQNIFNIFYGPSENCKALSSINSILVSIVIFLYIYFARLSGSFTQSLSASDLG
jgi:hypothetical protein